MAWRWWAGAAAYLRVSALLAGVACGATLALVGGRAVEQVARALGRFERPTYLMLASLAGRHLQATPASSADTRRYAAAPLTNATPPIITATSSAGSFSASLRKQ